MNNWSLIVRTPIAHSLPWSSLKRISRAFSLLQGLVIGAQALVHLLLYSDAIFAVIKSVTIQIMWSVLYNYVWIIIMYLETMPYWTTGSHINLPKPRKNLPNWIENAKNQSHPWQDKNISNSGGMWSVLSSVKYDSLTDCQLLYLSLLHITASLLWLWTHMVLPCCSSPAIRSPSSCDAEVFSLFSEDVGSSEVCIARETAGSPCQNILWFKQVTLKCGKFP